MSCTGYVVGRLLRLGTRDLSALLIYIIAPVVVFITVVESPADWTYFAFSIASFLTASTAAILAYSLGKWLWGDARANLYGFAGGDGNTGYFGLPIAFALFNPEQVAMAVFIMIGVNVYTFTVGYFISAKGVMDTRQSLRGIVRMPLLYAALLGVACKTFDITISPDILTSLDNFKGAFSILGMMMIGISLATFKKLEVDWTFLLWSLGWKHIIYPGLGVAFFAFVVPVPPELLVIIVLMLSTPMASNTVVIASHLGVHPERAALAVMTSTLVAAITVPLTIMWLG
ncbi:AEC family transporter [Xanthobacter sp. TB0139]|uniref:AEC family transporter n=1 Tax=Xanthobacter sp. TB0139 TaxID=3459178 RepID=UPI0040396D63